MVFAPKTVVLVHSASYKFPTVTSVIIVVSALFVLAKATTWHQEDLLVSLAPIPYWAALTAATPQSASIALTTPTSWRTTINAMSALHKMKSAGPARRT